MPGSFPLSESISGTFRQLVCIVPLLLRNVEEGQASQSKQQECDPVTSFLWPFGHGGEQMESGTCSQRQTFRDTVSNIHFTEE